MNFSQVWQITPILVVSWMMLHVSQFRSEAQVDHASYIKDLDDQNLENGLSLYSGLCVNCHGDGEKPALPTAPAFGASPLKFGNDPYSMWKTLTHGNGLMAPQTWMTEEERYDVVHYIREKLMKPMRDDVFNVSAAYLADLPKPAKNRQNKERIERIYEPVLGSQLERRIESALTIRLNNELTICYDLHTMDVADTWRGAFLDLSETHHTKLRGDGVPRPAGKVIGALKGWKWGHEGRIDYPTDGLLPRGPLPEKWMNYGGHHRFGSDVILSYRIDGRHIFEMPDAVENYDAIVHRFSVDHGKCRFSYKSVRRMGEAFLSHWIKRAFHYLPCQLHLLKWMKSLWRLPLRPFATEVRKVRIR